MRSHPFNSVPCCRRCDVVTHHELVVTSARSLLFVPGHKPAWFPRAQGAEADAVILDLEDAVGNGEKDAARDIVREWLHAGGEAIVRVNNDSLLRMRDLQAVGEAPGLVAVMVPKASAQVIAAVAKALPEGVPLLALIETGDGLGEARMIAGHPRVKRLAFGSLDMAVDLGCAHAREPLAFARSSLVLASRLEGLAAPIDGVTTAFRDLDVVADEAGYAKFMGFGGKLCIHPDQVETANRAFSPSADEIAWAVAVLSGADDGARELAGEMVDEPVRARARRVLSLAEPKDEA
jgi:citrate lyase subunit beta/citryl-CoA lyase